MVPHLGPRCNQCLATKTNYLRSSDDEWGRKGGRVRKIELGNNGHLSRPTFQPRRKGNQALGSRLLSGHSEPPKWSIYVYT